MEKLIKDGWAETAAIAAPVLAFTHLLFNILLAL